MKHLYFKNDFQSAVSWWVAAGINIKMIEDTQVVMRKDGYKGTYWTEPKNIGLVQLQPVHILPSLILGAGGICLASIIFIFEIISHKWKISKSREHKIRTTFLM